MKIIGWLKHQAGPLFWISSLQYYVVQFVVSTRWPVGGAYSWTDNTISDLGNTQCGLYIGEYVCSPWHMLMNASFLLLGFTMISGAILLKQRLENTRKSVTGLKCMILAGIGTILVGLFPENSIAVIHIIGAGLPFVFGSLSLLLIGVGMPNINYYIRIFTILSGLTGLVALIFFLAMTYGPLGIGGVERLVAYPQSIWMIIFGIYIIAGSITKDKN